MGPQPAENAGRYRQGATVTIRTTRGRDFASTVYAPKGSGLLGIAWSDIEDKYRTLMPNSGLGADRIEASLAAIRDFANADGVAPLIALIRPH